MSDKYQDTQFTVRLPREIGQALNRYAEESGQSRNGLVAVAVAKYLENEKKGE
jgi:predicted transcriptional regulator